MRPAAPALWLAMLGAVALAARSSATNPLGHPPRPAGKITITWLGHASFLVVSPGGKQLLLDPWLRQNPSTPDSLKDSSRYHPAAILVTHSHFDHSGDAKAIALDIGLSRAELTEVEVFASSDGDLAADDHVSPFMLP